MNFLTSLTENMPEVVDTHRCRVQYQKKFKFIAFILSLALEGKQIFGNFLSIPQEITIKIMLYMFEQKIFFHRPVFMKMHQKQIRPNEKIIIRKSYDITKQSQIKHQKSSFLSKIVFRTQQYKSKVFSNQNVSIPILYQINIINSWVMKAKSSENKNHIFKKWQHLHTFLKNVQIEATNQKCDQNPQQKNQRNMTNKLKCQLICSDKNLLLNEIQCLKSYGKSKIANSTEIFNIINLIQKNMIILTLKPLSSNSNQKINILFVHDQKRSCQNVNNLHGENIQKRKGRDFDMNIKCLNKNKIDLNDFPLVFNIEKQQWQIRQSYNKFCLTKEINVHKSYFICENGKEYNLNGHDMIEIQ